MGHGSLHGTKRPPVVRPLVHKNIVLSGSILDGPGNTIKVPKLAVHWPQVNASIPTPSYHWPMQEGGGNLLDSCNDFIMTPTGAGTYQNVVTNWQTRFLGTTEVAAQCWSAPGAGQDGTSSAWNVWTQSVFLYGLVSFISASSVRRWFAVNGTTHYLEILSNGLLRLDGGTTGSLDHRGTNIRPFVVEFIAGAGVTNHVGAGLYRLSTDIEQITGTWSWVPDNFKGPGATGVAAPPIMRFAELTVWTGTDAEALSTFTPKAFLQAVGWTISGY